MEDYDKLIDGGYYSDCKLKQPLYANKHLAEKLWDFSVDKLKGYLVNWLCIIIKNNIYILQ